MSDKSGKCAVIEFLAGKMVVYTGDTMPVMALTNSRYAESLEYWKKGAAPRFDPSKSFTRFFRAANMVREYGAKASRPPVDYAFNILLQVSQSSKSSNVGRTLYRTVYRTVWSVVYDQNNLRINFITETNKKIRTVNMNKFDFSCGTPVRVLDANADLAGDVTDKFQDYTQKINRDLIDASFNGTPQLWYVTSEEFDRISSYPDSMTCNK